MQFPTAENAELRAALSQSPATPASNCWGNWSYQVLLFRGNRSSTAQLHPPNSEPALRPAVDSNTDPPNLYAAADANAAVKRRLSALREECAPSALFYRRANCRRLRARGGSDRTDKRRLTNSAQRAERRKRKQTTASFFHPTLLRRATAEKSDSSGWGLRRCWLLQRVEPCFRRRYFYHEISCFALCAFIF